jgi:hypothetical protein
MLLNPKVTTKLKYFGFLFTVSMQSSILYAYDTSIIFNNSKSEDFGKYILNKLYLN